MDSSTETRKILASYYDESYVRKQIQRLEKLLDPLNQIGLAIIGTSQRGKNENYQDQQRRQRQALVELSLLSAKDRNRLFTALAPSIADEIESAWQVFDWLPYLTHYNRRPFRLGDLADPIERNRSRSEWVVRLMAAVRGYEQPVAWFAAWAAFLGWTAPDALGYLFAGSINRGGPTGQEVYNILIASARGDHPIGKMGRHVVRGLLCAPYPDGWDFIERLLLAAQREEGLRQVILEAADEAHPDAFRRILGIVVDQNLIRFSAILRAAAVWTGLPFDADSTRTADAILTRLRLFLDQPGSCTAVLLEGTPQDQYLALWSTAYQDVRAGIAAARPLLKNGLADHRLSAVYFLCQLQMEESERALLPMIRDEDIRVAVCALSGFSARGMQDDWYGESDLFEHMEHLAGRLSGLEKTLNPVLWDWMSIRVDARSIYDSLAGVLGSRPPSRLLPYLKRMSSTGRRAAAELFYGHIHEDPRYREALFNLAGDREAVVHEIVFSLLGKIHPRESEIPQLETLLTRKTSSLRRGVIGLLLRQEDHFLSASIERLLAMKDEQQRLAGMELLREMVGAGRAPGECRDRVNRLQAAGLTEPEKHLLAGLLTNDETQYSLKDALGLADLKNISQPVEPRKKTALFGLVKIIRLGSSAAAACLYAIDDLVDQHRTTPIEVNDWKNETRTQLLGSAYGWGLPKPDPVRCMDENRKLFQLAEVWEKWWLQRPKSQHDEDGLELLRAEAALSLSSSQYTRAGEWVQMVVPSLRTFLDEPYDFHLKYPEVVGNILEWLVYLHPAPDTVTFLLDAVEETCLRIGQDSPKSDQTAGGQRWAISRNLLGYIQITRRHRKLNPADWTAVTQARFWGFLKWLERSTWEKGGMFWPELEDVLEAVKAGAATTDDLYLCLLGGRQRFDDLNNLSRKRSHGYLKEYPFLTQVIDRCRERILKVELRRGDLPTAASAPAMALRSVPGMRSAVDLLSALGKAEFGRSGFFASDKNRSAVLSHLIRISYPVEGDTADDFAAMVRSARITDRRLVELAVYAPQWAQYVEQALGWQGMSEGVWWIYAHTKDRQWSADIDIRESWATQINQYTPLSADELLDGAVDVAWFHRTYTTLGETRWQEIYRAALYASSGTGHARARLFADAMLGHLTTAELTERIRTKRHQDSVRALGLVPLQPDLHRQTDILQRYEVLQEYLRTSRQFGSQRQASEKLAANIGMENLARTAGYTDPQRLEWAMELAAVSDLRKGPVSIQANGLAVTLSVNDLGAVELEVRRGDRVLKNIPPDAKKDDRVAALVARKQALERQAHRMRTSLETAMIRGDLFNAGELQHLLDHPILRVMLQQLVFVDSMGMGYLCENGQVLEGLGRQFRLKPEDVLRIAHPEDLLQSGCWHDWQHDCFVAERIQPFKQIFRELYLLTGAEQDEENFSRRYAGHQVNPRQALALFTARGWVIAPEEGVFKTFHAEGLVARVGFLQTIATPAEMEGLTVEAVGFTRRGEWLTIGLETVPPRLFSEVMRDLDLVVSVAHAGGVDPEASLSTIESRSTLVVETCTLLGLTNVRVQNRYALIDGTLGNYTVHLGSGVVHKQPGGSLCIIPIHSQHRGRVFLPFADDDPKTAEVISKVLLLSKDKEIKDPTILEQILR